jgi:hypothetical protein
MILKTNSQLSSRCKVRTTVRTCVRNREYLSSGGLGEDAIRAPEVQYGKERVQV